jgi:hypothetical protein
VDLFVFLARCELPGALYPCLCIMGKWELRFFFRRKDLNEQWVHPALAARSGAVEDRTDTYFPADAAAGLKLRGGGGMELKVRQERDENGFEKWQKSHENSLGAAMSTLRLSVDETVLRSAAVVVQKTRVQAMLGLNACVEQTELSVAAAAGDAGGAQPPQRQPWCTVCLEGKRKTCLPLLEQIRAACVEMALDGEVLQCGYPEWVARNPAACLVADHE